MVEIGRKKERVTIVNTIKEQDKKTPVMTPTVADDPVT